MHHHMQSTQEMVQHLGCLGGLLGSDPGTLGFGWYLKNHPFFGDYT